MNDGTAGLLLGILFGTLCTLLIFPAMARSSLYAKTCFTGMTARSQQIAYATLMSKSVFEE